MFEGDRFERALFEIGPLVTDVTELRDLVRE